MSLMEEAVKRWHEMDGKEKVMVGGEACESVGIRICEVQWRGYTEDSLLAGR